MKTNQAMKKSILWNTSGSIFYYFCQWAITILVVRLSKDYIAAGNLSLAMTTSSTFSAISLFSMRNFQISDITEKYNNKIYVGSRIVTCFLAYFMCTIWIFANSYSLLQRICIEAFMLIRIAEAMVDVLHGVAQKHWRYDLIGKSFFLRGILTILSFVLLIITTSDLKLTLVIMAALNLCCAIFFDLYQVKKIDVVTPVLKNKKVVQLLKECLPIVIFNFLLSLINLIPKLVLEKQAGTDLLGIYSSIASPTLIVQLFASVAFNPMVPLFTDAYLKGDRKKYRQLLHKTLFLLVVLAITASAGGVLFGEFGLQILFGDKMKPYVSLLLPIIWCTLLTAFIWVLSAILIALRKTKALMYGMIAACLVCLLSVKKMILVYGMNGVSITQIIVMGLFLAYLFLLCERVGKKK